MYGLRLIKKEVVFTPRRQGGLGLDHSWNQWKQHNRAVAIRCIKAFAQAKSPQHIPSWIMPGYSLLKLAFHPWGSPHDLLYANMDSHFIKQLSRNPNLSLAWTSLLARWADIRWTPQRFPSTTSIDTLPLWHNHFLPGLENLYDDLSTTTQWQIWSLASLRITKLQHLLTPDRLLWPASLLHPTIKSTCTLLNLSCPSQRCINTLVVRLSKATGIPTACASVTYTLPSGHTPWTIPQWLIDPGGFPHPLSHSSSRSAKLLSYPQTHPIPTKHLNLHPTFYTDPKRLRGLRHLTQPKHILPRYSEFVYKAILGAHALQYLFQYREPRPKCIFCNNNETYEHFLFECEYGQAVWEYFKCIQQTFNSPFPLNAVEMFFDLPHPGGKYYRRGLLIIWPIIRACVYYKIWLQRVDRTFRPDLAPNSPQTTALEAAQLIKLHLQQLLYDITIKKGYTKVFITLKKLSENPWLASHIIPASILT